MPSKPNPNPKKATKPIEKPKRLTREEMKRTAPGQARMKLTVSGLKDETLRPYWATESQIPELEAAGYRMARRQDVHRIGSAFRDRNNDPGSLVSIQSGQDRLYLMLIEKDLYIEYQAIKQESVDETENAIRNPGADDTFYSPSKNVVEEEKF